MNEKCVFANQELMRTWLRGEGTDLQTLAIIPPPSSSAATGLAIPGGSAALPFPERIPKQTVWMTAGLLVSSMQGSRDTADG